MPLKTGRGLMPLALAAASFAGQAVSGPLAYDEAVQGDLSSSGPIAVLSLGTGLNTVKGTFTALQTPDSQLSWDMDAFVVQMPANHVITSVSVSLQATDTFSNTNVWKVYWNVFGAPQPKQSCFLVSGVAPDCQGAPTGGSLLSDLPLSTESLFISQSTWMNWKDGAIPYGGPVNYTVSFQVSAVPEPAGLLLMAGGLGLLGLRLRRR